MWPLIWLAGSSDVIRQNSSLAVCTFRWYFSWHGPKITACWWGGTCHSYEFLDLHSSVIEDCSLLGCGAVSLCFLTFWRNVLPLSSKESVYCTVCEHCVLGDGGDIYLQNVGSHLHSYPTRLESSNLWFWVYIWMWHEWWVVKQNMW